MQQPIPTLENVLDPTTAMNMALILIAKAFKLNQSTPTNNNQRISSNPHNRQIAQPVQNLGVQNVRNQNRLIVVSRIANQNVNQNRNGNVAAARVEGNAGPRRRNAAYYQAQLLIAQKEEAGIQLQAEEFDLMADAGDMDEIEEVNANCILVANLQQALTSGSQTNKAPVYDSDGSVVVRHSENCNDNDIFNMFIQEEQYTKLLEPIVEPRQETRAYYESLFHNLAIEVENVNTVNRNLKATIAYLTTELARYRAEGDLRKFSDIGAWYAIEDCAQDDKKDTGVTSPESTIQTLPLFEEYTPPVTYPEEVEKFLGNPIEVEPLNETKLEEVGLNCNHNTPLSFREVPSFDKPEPQPQPLPNYSPLDASLGTERGLKPPIKSHSPDSSRMKVVDYLTTQTPPSPYVVNSHPKGVYSYYNPGIDDPKIHYGFKPGLLGKSVSLGVDISNWEMFDDDWRLESNEVSPLGEELNLFDRPNEVERGRILEARRLEPILQQQNSQCMAPSHRGYQNPFYLKQAQQKQQSLYNGRVLLEKHDPLVVYDSEETLQLAQESHLKMQQLNKEIKPANYAKFNKLFEVFVSQKAKSREEISDDTSPSVAWKFLNEVNDTLVTLQRVIKHRMNGNVTKMSSSTHQEIHNIFEDEFVPLVNQVDAREADDSLDKIKILEFVMTSNNVYFIASFIPLITEYFVNISKRRAFWSLNEDILKINVLTTNMPWLPTGRTFDLKGKIIASSKSECQSDISEGRLNMLMVRQLGVLKAHDRKSEASNKLCMEVLRNRPL
ncbi:hypothetical protein Tco_0628436 [Tanacetum coccineum]|uniref:Uncharacterized protein n=1 Tax=Tanacetum coccineum TaxID=301880 RepID=A0ABQ4WQB0_9ASTR